MEISIIAEPDIEQYLSGATEKFRSFVIRRMEKTLRAESMIVKNELNLLTKTWNHYPGFNVMSGMRGDEFFVTVETHDEVFFYLDQGTKVRYATMTKEFSAKTSPNSLRSGRGDGGVAYVDRRVERPGILARNFMRTLRNKREPHFNQNLNRAFYTSIDRWWSSLFGK